jgi:hypothetical protein
MNILKNLMFAGLLFPGFVFADYSSINASLDNAISAVNSDLGQKQDLMNGWTKDNIRDLPNILKTLQNAKNSIIKNPNKRLNFSSFKLGQKGIFPVFAITSDRHFDIPPEGTNSLKALLKLQSDLSN